MDSLTNVFRALVSTTHEYNTTFYKYNKFLENANKCHKST